MKTEFNRTIDPTTATRIAHQGISAVMAEFNTPSQYPHWNGRRVSSGSFWVTPDWTGYTIGFTLSDGGRTVEMWEVTCGGHFHSLRIETKTGHMTVTHDGSRRSVPGCFPIPEDSQFWWLNNAHDWTLTLYETSESSWAAISGLLRGQVGDGPTNAEEADQFRLHEIRREARRAVEAAGIPWPLKNPLPDYGKKGGIVWLFEGPNGFLMPYKWHGDEKKIIRGVAL